MEKYIKFTGKKAPGMGFEPMRTVRSTGSQGPRVIHSAIPALFVKLGFLFISVFRSQRLVCSEKVINRQVVGRLYGKQRDRLDEC